MYFSSELNLRSSLNPFTENSIDVLQDASLLAVKTWAALFSSLLDPTVKLCVGNETRATSSLPALPRDAAALEQWRQDRHQQCLFWCLDHEFEFVPMPFDGPSSPSSSSSSDQETAAASAADELTGVERVCEALSCHVWTHMTRQPKSMSSAFASQSRKQLEQSADQDENEAEGSSQFLSTSSSSAGFAASFGFLSQHARSKTSSTVSDDDVAPLPLSPTSSASPLSLFSGLSVHSAPASSSASSDEADATASAAASSSESASSSSETVDQPTSESSSASSSSSKSKKKKKKSKKSGSGGVKPGSTEDIDARIMSLASFGTSYLVSVYFESESD